MEQAPSYAQLLRQNQGFRRIWLGEVVSFFGDWFKTIALYTIVQSITDSAQAVAGVLVTSLLPIFLVIPVAGPIVDRFDRRKVMILTDLARAACALGLIAAWWAESLWLLFAVQVVMVGFSGVFLPARGAALPQLTSRAELPVALALSGGTWSVMLAFGAALGGVVTEAVGVGWALLLDGLSFLVSAMFLAKLPPLPPREAGDTAARATFAGGLRYLRARPYLSTVLLLKPAIGLTNALVAVIPLLGGGVFAGASGPMYVGMLHASRGVGALIGTLGSRRVTGDNPRVLRACVPFGFLFSALAYVGLWQASSVWLAALCLIAGTTGTGMVWVSSGILSQYASDQAYRGRVYSLEFGVLTLLSAGVSWLGGAAVDWWGWAPQEIGLATAASLLVPAAAWPLAMLALRPEGDGRPPG